MILNLFIKTGIDYSLAVNSTESLLQLILFLHVRLELSAVRYTIMGLMELYISAYLIGVVGDRAKGFKTGVYGARGFAGNRNLPLRGGS